LLSKEDPDLYEMISQDLINAQLTITPLSTLSQKLKNPYTNIFYWVKGELLDCLSL